MPNAYINQAGNVPPARGAIAVGQKVKTIYGEGTITALEGVNHGPTSAMYDIDPIIIATIIVPCHPPKIFKQKYQTLVFTNGIGGETSALGLANSNL